MSGRNPRTVGAMTLLIAVALTMVAAPVYVLLGTKGIGMSSSLWTIAVALCRVVTGLFGLLAIVSAVTRRGSRPSRDNTLGSVASGVVLIAAAVAGLGLVIVITGFAGLVLLYAGGAQAVDALHSWLPKPVPPPQRGEGIEPCRHPPALPRVGG